MMNLLFLVFAAGIFGQRCSQPRERREIRDLSSGERVRFVNAIRALHSGRAPTQYDRFARIHIDAAPLAHGSPLFFTWHREYLLQFEALLQTVDPSVVLPFWDWTRDASDPTSSPIFGQSYMGGNGGEDGCVLDGPFSGWNMEYPDPHCLKRSFENGRRISRLFSMNALLDIIATAPTFARLTSAVEALPHSRVHIGIGGRDGDLAFMFSSNDPIFWLHHAYIDRIYFEWQQRNPRVAASLSGDPTQQLEPFPATSEDVFNTTSGGRYCYTYPRILSSNSGGAQQVEASVEAASAKAREDNRDIAPLPDYWIQRNHMDPATIRSLEFEYGIGTTSQD